MLSKQRRMIIMELLEQRGFATVKELCELLHISRSSVMRDLCELEQQGLLQRERGGAALRREDMTMLTSFNEIPVMQKEALHAQEKQMICQRAAETIREGDCVYVDSGTTPAFLLPYIAKKRIKLVTANTYLIRKLPDSFRGDLYLLGGEFHKAYDTSYGPLTLEMIRQFNFDQAFFSTNGVNADNGEVYVFEFAIGAVKRAILQRSVKNYLLADSSKLQLRALCTWAQLPSFHSVYTDSFPKGKELPENVVLCKK